MISDAKFCKPIYLKYFRQMKLKGVKFQVLFVIVMVTNACNSEQKNELDNNTEAPVSNVGVNTDVNADSQPADIVDELNPLQKIKNNFKRINSIKNWVNIKSVDILEESTEGGTAEFYYSATNLEKMIVKLFGETGKIIQEYYLIEDELSFLYVSDYSYNTHIIEDDFDLKKANIVEMRHYFGQDTLFKQLSSESGNVLYNAPYFEEETDRIQADFSHYVKLVLND